MKTATLACGCFWSVQRTFQRVKGVRKVECGYTGGKVVYPTYEMVCTGKTGHVEAVRIHFDGRSTSFQTLLKTFWEIHDPTIDHAIACAEPPPPVSPKNGAKGKQLLKGGTTTTTTTSTTTAQYHQFMRQHASADVGDQYRSVIFYHDEEQKKTAEASRDSVQRWIGGKLPIRTAILPAKTFWVAEDVHQDHTQKIVDLYDSYLNHG